MKASYQINDNLFVDLEFNTTKELVEQLTILEEIRTEPCGRPDCKSSDTFLRARLNGEDLFFGMECRKCHAVLELGVKKDSNQLYKKRIEANSKGKAVKDESGKAKFLPNNGWMRYNSKTGQKE